jgi:multidrug efflux pump subunit AcrA (membrane-fusion protein)
MRLFKFLLPVLVIVATVFLAKYFLATGPQAKKKPFVKKLSVVETLPLKEQSYSVTIKASGIVKAGIQTNLVAEASGRVISVSDNFLEGSYFNKKQTLLKIDSANYDNALAITESDVAANQASLVQLNEEEKSIRRSLLLSQKNLKIGLKELKRMRSLWAKKLIARTMLDKEEQNYNQLQQKVEDLQGRLNGFTSRKGVTQAKIKASLTRVTQERSNLSKTVIKAPYSGRVLSKQVDVGQFVNKGTVLGKIYATNFVTVDLPLSLAKYQLLNIPEAFQGQTVKGHFPSVVFKDSSQSSSNRSSTWQGKIVRTSAALDADTRQIKVIAKIESPFKASSKVATPIKVGQYINAEIQGKTFNHVYVLPAGAVRQNKEILLLKDNKVHITPVEVLWNSANETVVRSNENIKGENIITTALTQATEGMRVITLKQQQQKELEKSKESSDSDGAH